MTLPEASTDWYPGAVPLNIRCDPSAYIGSSFTFRRFRSRRCVGLRVGPQTTIGDGTTLDVGPEGCVNIGMYAVLNSTVVMCDNTVTIGDYSLLGWHVVIMDSYRGLDRRIGAVRGPVCIGNGVWIGFGACILPDVKVGDGAVIGAQAVVASDVPPRTIAVGNPARVVRSGAPCDFEFG